MVERWPRFDKLSGTKELYRAVEIRLCFLRKLRRYTPYFLEVVNCAIGFASSCQRINELQSCDEIRRCGSKHVSQPVFISACASATGLLSLEISKRVQHVSIAWSVAADPL